MVHTLQSRKSLVLYIFYDIFFFDLILFLELYDYCDENRSIYRTYFFFVSQFFFFVSKKKRTSSQKIFLTTAVIACGYSQLFLFLMFHQS